MDSKSKTPKIINTLETQEAPASASHFSFTVTKVAVSQICQSVGFKGSTTSALETLTSIATIYLQTLAKSAASTANSSGRTDSNLFDLVNALEDLASVRGFRDASNLRKPLLRSTTLIDLMNFVETTDEIPFAMPIPRNNPPKKLNSSKNRDVVFARDFEQKSQIPRWLPPFPDPNTYKIRNEIKSICGGNDRNSDTFERDFEYSSSQHSHFGQDSSRLVHELPTERARVRFKMGVRKEGGLGLGLSVDLRNGVCRGGKRICWHNDTNRMDEQGEEKDSNSIKRRR